MPVHDTLEEYLDRYIEAAELATYPKEPLGLASGGIIRLYTFCQHFSYKKRCRGRRVALSPLQKRASRLYASAVEKA